MSAPIVRRRILSGLLAVSVFAPVCVRAQEPPPAAKPAAATPAPEREKADDRRARPLVNVRVDVRIADQRGADPKVKTVSLTAADREYAKVRSHVVVTPRETAPQFYPINVDARPMVEGGKIRLALTVTYDFPPATAGGGSADTLKLVDEMVVWVESGKPLVVAESADALTDRKVSVEVTATLLR